MKLKKFKISGLNSRSPGFGNLKDKVSEFNGELLAKPNSEDYIIVFDYTEDYNSFSKAFDYIFDDNSQILVNSFQDTENGVYLSEIRLKNMEIPKPYLNANGTNLYYLKSGIRINSAWVNENFMFTVTAFRFKNGFEEVKLIEGSNLNDMKMVDDYYIILESYRIKDIILETNVKGIVSNMINKIKRI